MLAGMRFCFLLLLAACGGKAIPPDQNGDDSGPFGRGQDSGDGGNNYVNPECPDVGAPVRQDTCNVYDPNGCIGGNCCPSGSACYPVVIPPGAACTPEVYGSFCITAGVGTQGSDCSGTDNCAGGFVCLITGASTQCAQMCDPSQGHVCAEGFVCEPIDVPGFSACL